MRATRFAWFTLVLNIAVILWGAFVRATGSGAGCGEHWPLCNGDVLPRAAEAATLIEFTHRLTSGLALIAVFWLAAKAYARRPVHRALRRAALASVVLILTEAAVGAGLVLFRLVADNDSMARALFMGVHLINTFLLLAALTLTAYLSDEDPRVGLRRSPALLAAYGAALLLMTIAGASGAVAALGDTLFPSGSLAEALQQDLSPTSHLLIRLRILHPVLAITSGLVIVAVLRIGAWLDRGALDARLATAIPALVAVQIAGGFLNVVLLAPVWMQLVHLLVADLLWVAVVLAGASQLLTTERADESRASALATPALMPSPK